MNFPGKFGSHLAGSPAALEGGPISLGRHADGTGDTQSHAIVIPDAHLLFSGDFKREGLDLVLSNDHQRHVVQDYFKGDKHAALMSLDGARLSAAVVDALTGYTVYAQAAPAASGGQVIGRVLKLSGSASVVRNGVTIELGVGEAVQKGDVVQTGSDSSIGITFIDGSAFGMTSNARMVLNEMVFDPNGSSNSSLISLVQGTVTFVAGQTAKNGNMRVETPVATMGIRGTAVLVEIGANDGPTKFSILVEPDGTTGSYNLYDNKSGQLIGTVSRAGQVTFVSPNGTNQVTAVEQLKTLADQQQEKAIVQQVFQLYFPNYIPDQNVKPNSNKSGSNGSGNNLAEIHVTTPPAGTTNALLTIELKFAKVDPNTGQTTYSYKTYFNSLASFSTFDVAGGQNILAPANGFNIGDQVKIVDIDIGTAPFFDVATPFIPGTAAFTNATSSIPLPAGFDLYGLVSVNQTTGRVNYDAQRFNFLSAGETIVYKVEFDSSSGPDRAHLSLRFTVTGANDAPVFDIAPVQVAVSEIGGQTNHVPQTGQPDIISTAVVIGFSDADFTDLGANYQAVVANVTSSGSTAGLPQNDNLHPTALKDALLSYFNFSTTPVTKLLDTTNGHIDGTFSATDKTFDYLAAGQQLVLTYTVQITDPANASAVLTKNFTVTVTGSNDAPMLAVDTANSPHQALEITDTTNASTLDTTSGTLSFTDADLTDTHQASVALNAGTAAVVWSGGAYNDIPSATRAALAAGMTVSVATDSNLNGTANGSLAWNFSLPDNLFDFLGHSETLTILYDVTVKDYNGANPTGTVSTQQVAVQITASNDKPVITAVNVTGAVTEDANVVSGSIASTGSVSFADADATDHETATVAFVGDTTTSAAAIPAGLHTALSSALSLTTSSYASNIGTIDWTFALGNSLVQYLAAGETVTATYTITVKDNSGVNANDTSAPQTVTVTITGTNDAPVITADISGALGSNVHGVGETDTTLATTGTLTVTDLDVANTVAASVLSVAVGGTGPASALAALNNAALKAMMGVDVGNVIDNVSTTGAIHWSFDSGAQAFDFLGDGETLLLTYTIRATDSDASHATGDQTVVIKITGTNDAPVVAAVDVSGAVTEQITTPTGNLTDSGAISFDDVDLTDTHAINSPIVVSNGALGTLTASVTTATAAGAGGVITWNYSVADSAVEYLAEGQTKVESFTLTLNDGHGGAIARTIDVTITGTNDAAVITSNASVATKTFIELAATTGSSASDQVGGTITFADVDLIDTHIVSQTAATYVWSGGTLTATQINALTAAATAALIPHDSTGTGAGSVDWTYAIADGALDFLRAGETLSVAYNVTITDNSGTANNIATQPVSVTFTGVNDAPAIASITGVALNEPTATTALHQAITASFADVDLTDTGQTASVRKVVATSGATPPGVSLNVDLTGGALFALLSAGSVTKSSGSASGSASFSFDAASTVFDYLAAGESVTLTYTVAVTDALGAQATNTVAVAITGTNDAPLVTTTSGTITELSGSANTGNATTSGTISFTDVDLSEAPTVTSSFSGFDYKDASGTSYTSLTAAQQAAVLAVQSTLSLTASGGNANDGSVAWSYTVADNKLDFLAAGEKLTLTYNATVDDGHTTTVKPLTITITGTNDAPAITAAVNPPDQTEAANASAQNLPSIDGTLTVADADIGNTITASVTGPGVATLNLNSFTSAFNYAALIAATAITFDAATSNGHATTINWHYDPAAANIDFLRSADVLTIEFTAQVTDGYGNVGSQPLVITIYGSNDTPTIVNVTDPNAVIELLDASAQDIPAISGILYVADLDVADSLIGAVSANGVVKLNGSPTLPSGVDLSALTNAAAVTFAYITSDGAANQSQSIGWTYDPAAANLDFLKAGDVLTVEFTAQVGDGSGFYGSQLLTITINGANDAPTITAGAPDHHLVEGTSAAAGTASASALLALADIDGTASYDTAALATGGWSDNHDGTYTKAGLYGSATLDTALNKVVYALGNNASATNSLTSSDHPTDTFAVPVTDGSLTASANVVFTIDGANDAAVIGNASATSVREGDVDSAGNLIAAGSIAISDVDSAATFQAGVVSAAGNLGNLSLATNGQYTYTVSNTDPGVQALDGATSHIDTFTVTAQDGTTKDVSFTIEGANQNMSTSANEAFNATAGRDNFVFNANFGHDSISGFSPGSDAILFDHTVFANVADVMSAITSTAMDPDTVITHDPANTLTLNGITLAQIQAHQSDFHFV